MESVQSGQVVVDLNGGKVVIEKFRRRKSGKVTLKGRVLIELTPAPVTQQPPQTYRGEDDPPPLSPQVPSPSPQQTSTPGVKNVSKGQSLLSCSRFNFDSAVKKDETEGKRKTRSSRNDEGSEGQAVVKLVNVEQTGGVGVEGSEVVDPPPETVGGDSSTSRASTQGDDGETRLRNSQVKRTKEKVKVSTKKHPVFRSDNMKQMRKTLSSIINFHKHENTTRDPALEGNKSGATKIFKTKAKEQTVKGKKCSVCRKAFRYPSSLSRHLATHRPERPFPCGLCKAAFKTAYHLKRHQETHMDPKDVPRSFVSKLPNYGKKLRTKRALVKRNQVHSNWARDHVCDTCGKAFKKKWALISHEVVHSEIRNHICRRCDIGFKRSGDLRRHLANIHGQKPDPDLKRGKVGGDYYGKRETRMTTRQDKRKASGSGSRNDEGLGSQPVVKVKQAVGVEVEGSEVVDPPPETVGGDSPGVTTRGDEGGKRLRNRQVKVTKKVKVSIQKRPFPRSNNFKQQKKNCIVNNPKRQNDPPSGPKKMFKKKCTKCGYCGRKFRHPSSLSSHLATHRHQRPFPCATRGADFKTVFHLKRQQVRHMDPKDIPRSFVCKLPDCGRTFTTKRALISHDLVHSETRNQICNICGKGFKRSGDLRRHLANVHVEETSQDVPTPFVCKLQNCMKKFGTKWALISHELVHSETRDQICVLCKKGYKRSGDLRRHLANVH